MGTEGRDSGDRLAEWSQKTLFMYHMAMRVRLFNVEVPMILRVSRSVRGSGDRQGGDPITILAHV